MQRRYPQGYRIQVPEASCHCQQETTHLLLDYNADIMQETHFLNSKPSLS